MSRNRRISRLFVPQGFDGEGDIQIPPEEAHHAGVVLRLRSGDAVELFDGNGHVAMGTITSMGGGAVTVRIEQTWQEKAPLPKLTLATAVPKGKRWQQLVEKCTECGASRILPVRFERSVAEGGADSEKWRRWAIEAAKQCGRQHLPEIPAPVEFVACVEDAAPDVAYVADAEGEPLLKFAAHMGAAEEILVLVGPEGGLTEAEAEACRAHGFGPLRLGPHILRVETAAVAACAAIRALLQ